MSISRNKQKIKQFYTIGAHICNHGINIPSSDVIFQGCDGNGFTLKGKNITYIFIICATKQLVSPSLYGPIAFVSFLQRG